MDNPFENAVSNIVGSTDASHSPTISLTSSRKSKTSAGRPPIPWTGSRKRKICKLYLFSILTMDEIVKVIQSPGFTPCKRNVEDRLFRIMPKLPRTRSTASNYKILRQGWEQFKRCKEGRVEKTRGTMHRRSQPVVSQDFPSTTSGILCTRLGSQHITNASFFDTGDGQNTAFMYNTNSEVTLDTYQTSLQTQRPQQLEDARIHLTSRIATADHLSRILPRRSEHILQHVASICSSSTTSLRSSWRSSIASITSTIRSKNSSKASINQQNPLSASEQEIWEECIDEEAIAGFVSSIRRSKKLNVHLSKVEQKSLYRFEKVSRNWPLIPSFDRSCCPSNKNSVIQAGDQPDCNTCGLPACFSMREPENPPQGDWDVRDHYDNSILHYAAETANRDFRRLHRLVKQGYNIRSINTSGGSFLHILAEMDPESFFILPGFGASNPLISLLESLRTLDFPFEHRDHYGRSIAHLIFYNGLSLEDLKYGDSEALLLHIEELCSILKPDLYTLDVFGRSVAQVLLLWQSKLEETNNGSLQTIISNLLSRYGDWKAPQKFYEPSKSSNYSQWIEITRSVGYADNTGSSPLISMLKGWTYEHGEPLDESSRLLSMGCQFHDRDRDGNTPLSIAVTQGLPQITALLLEKGANPNIRSNYGESLLSQAERSLTKAKRTRNETLYAKVLHCMRHVTVAGAVADPTALQEWGSSEIIKKKRGLGK